MLETIQQPLTIGSLTLPHRLIQAPLAGISCYPFRRLFSYFKRPAYAATEMISATDLIHRKRLDTRYVLRAKDEGLLCYQLSSHRAFELVEAIKMVEDLGADIIDLNCGCPKHKITAKGRGAALIKKPKLLYELVSSMRQATSLPLTVKIRTQGSSDETDYLLAAKVIEEAGADAIIVHGRHATDGYDIPCHYHQIENIVESLSIPVIANGDVLDRASLEKCLRESKAQAVMVGRGSIGRPWLYAQLFNPDFAMPSFKARVALFGEHIEDLAEVIQSEYIALLQARRFIKHYFPELEAEAQQRLFLEQSIQDLVQALAHYQSPMHHS